MHLQPQRAFAATVPSPPRELPTEIIHPHALAPITTNSKLIESAFRAEVRVRSRMFKYADRSDEVLEFSGFPRGNRRSANEMEFPIRAHPVDHRRLNELIAVNDHRIFSPISRECAQVVCKQFTVEKLLIFRNIKLGVDLSRVQASEYSPVGFLFLGIHLGQQQWAK